MSELTGEDFRQFGREHSHLPADIQRWIAIYADQYDAGTLPQHAPGEHSEIWFRGYGGLFTSGGHPRDTKPRDFLYGGPENKALNEHLAEMAL